MNLIKTGIFSKIIEKKDQIESGELSHTIVVHKPSSDKLKVKEFESFFKSFSPIIKDKKKVCKENDEIIKETRNKLISQPLLLSQKQNMDSCSIEWNSRSPSFQRSLSELNTKSIWSSNRMFKKNLNRSFVEEERNKIELANSSMQIKVFRPEGNIEHVYNHKVEIPNDESPTNKLRINFNPECWDVKIEVDIIN